MTTPADENSQRVVKVVQELLVDMGDRSAVTPALIGEKIDIVLTMMPKWGEQLDREGLADSRSEKGMEILATVSRIFGSLAVVEGCRGPRPLDGFDSGASGGSEATRTMGPARSRGRSCAIGQDRQLHWIDKQGR